MYGIPLQSVLVQLVFCMGLTSRRKQFSQKGVVFIYIYIWFYMYLIWIYDDLWSFEAPVSPCQVESRALHHLPDGSLTTGRLMSFAVSDTERGQLATCALWVLGSTLPSEEPSGPYRGFSFACSQANQGSTVITNILPIYYTNILPHNTTRSVSCRAFFALLSAAFSKKPLLSVGLSYLVSTTGRVWHAKHIFALLDNALDHRLNWFLDLKADPVTDLFNFSSDIATIKDTSCRYSWICQNQTNTRQLQHSFRTLHFQV